MKKTISLALLSIVIFSCNVRRNDSLADDSLVKKEQVKKQILENREIALKDSTSVVLIDSVFDFGSATEGDLVKHNFAFKNTGTKPLVIQDAHASCGCTVPEKPEMPIMPGETGVIKVIFDTKGKHDHQEKVITVNSNAKPEFGPMKLVGMVK